MRLHDLLRATASFIGVVWALLVLGGAATAAPTDLVFLVAEAAPIENVSVEDLKNIYLGKKRVWAGSQVFAVDQSETEPVKLDFLKHILHMTHAEYRAHLLKQRFQEGAVTPRFVGNSTEVLRAIRETTGAIGYVYQSDVGNLLGLKALVIVPSK